MYKFISVLAIVFVVPVLNGQERDPTQPIAKNLSGKLSQQKKSLKLESIVNQGQQKIAIINGKLVKVGEMFGQYRVKEIGKSNVILATAEKQIELSLFRQVVASPQ